MTIAYYTSVPVKFREDKTTQAAARLLEKAGGYMNHMKLIKLLYFAERRALIQWGRPITYDWYVSMNNGPVLSFTLDMINGEAAPGQRSYWHEYISERKGHQVGLVKTPVPTDQLSRAEEQLIDEIYDELGAFTQWELRDLAHKLPEWRDPNGSSLPISIPDILRAEGLSDSDVCDVEDALRAEALAARLAGA